MNEVQLKAMAAYEDASRKLKNGVHNGPFGLRGRAYEVVYATTYQALVKVGVAPQLKGKYRYA